jgi:SAM-dependent methyltransferase
MKDRYLDGLERLLKQRLLDCNMRVLVVCGGKHDREVLLAAGFKNVTISNLDIRLTGSEFAPYGWSFQDAENLTFKDGEFDFCIVHDGLHHCQSPHRGLLEMYRVATKGLLVFEPRDSVLTRVGVKLNFGQDYEVAAVFDNDQAFGGVRNSEIPNYIYRWTEREIEKTICTNAPWGRHRFIYFYQIRVPWARLRMLKNKLWYFSLLAALPALKMMQWIFPRQSNTFGFAVFKPDPAKDLQPWIQHSNGQLRVDKAWLSSRYNKLDDQEK